MNIKVDDQKLKNSAAKKPFNRSKASFRAEKTIEQLIQEQGIKPIDDFSKISGGWEDVDIDAFIKEVRGS